MLKKFDVLKIMLPPSRLYMGNSIIKPLTSVRATLNWKLMMFVSPRYVFMAVADAVRKLSKGALCKVGSAY